MTTISYARERAKKIAAARELLVEAAMDLDCQDTACKCCGSYRRHNFAEFDLFRKLEGATERLDGMLRTLEAA